MFVSPVVPHHIAIVMDGNGRWAKRRFLPRLAGHKQGVDSLRRCVRACAERKGLSMDHWEEMDEVDHAKNHFELGCWLYFYQRSFYDLSKDNINERVQCMLRLFLNGFTNPGYSFYTVFDFGERQFDSIMEMGDSERVKAEMQKALPLDKTGKIAAAFSYHGWSTN